MNEAILIQRTGALTTITLNRPDRHNAFDDRLIADLTIAFEAAGADAATRAVALDATGSSFSAGADLEWMRRIADYSEADNLGDAKALARLIQTIDRCPKPVIGLVQGAAFGGGVGLVAACDIAIASDRAVFCLTEVRLGLIPAVIGPYAIRAMGERACRRYFLTAERFDAATALALGLVHAVVPPDRLATARDATVGHILKGGPEAIAAAKDLIHTLAHPAPGLDVTDYTARRIAETRASAEGKEGLGAFLDKRRPAWIRE